MFKPVDKLERQEIGAVYQAQCPAAFLRPLFDDKATFTIMAIGHRRDYDYLQA